MRIGVPKEIKVHEYRVGLTPESVRKLVAAGHRVLVERNAGSGIGAQDADYLSAGADIAATAEDVFAAAELIVKVKEPQAAERASLRAGQTLFTYLHLAPDPEQTRELVSRGAVAIAYETVTSPDGRLPLLAPMSEIAGRMAAQVAAHHLEKPHGGRGVLLSGATGIQPARVLVLGAGVVGGNAAAVALGMGAEVMVMNPAADALDRLRARLGPHLQTAQLTEQTLEANLHAADAVICAALAPGAQAPRLITRAMLAGMKAGAVIVDVSIDQGGCCETSHPTTHADPVYVVDGVLHYCVANMPGAVPRTSTYALNHATLPFVEKLATQGIAAALRSDAGLRDGLNICAGAVTQREVACALNYPYMEPLHALGTAPLH